MEKKDSRIRTIEIYVMLLIDLLAAIVSYELAYMTRFKKFRLVHMTDMYTIVLLIIVLFIITYSLLFNPSNKFLTRGYLVELIYAVKYEASMAVVLASALFAVKLAEDYSRLMYGYFLIWDIVITYVVRQIVKRAMRKHYRDEKNQNKLLILSNAQYIDDLIPEIKSKLDIVYHICGIVAFGEYDKEKCNGITVIPGNGVFIDTVKTMAIDEVFIYLPDEKKSTIKILVDEFQTMGVICHYNIDVADLHTNIRVIDEVAGFTVVSYSMNQIDYNKRMIKRMMDILGALIGSVITIIVFPFVALAIKADSKGPVIFKQKRMGRNGRVFNMYKFRSMYSDAEERKQALMEKNEMDGLMFKMEDDPRITKVGKFIRKTSIDELPQFFNILKGDMSLVGTRPPTVDEYEQYSTYYMRRLSMKPGLTGMWQVSGRSNIKNFDEVVKHDLEYIDHWSLTLDMKILFQTIGVVFTGKGSK